MSFCRKALLIV